MKALTGFLVEPKDILKKPSLLEMASSNILEVERDLNASPDWHIFLDVTLSF